MAMIVLDRDLEKRLIRKRRAIGSDRFDEVWDGVYVMSPVADNEHSDVIADLIFVFKSALLGLPGVRVSAAVNLSDREDEWRKNYRCPDLAVFFAENTARDKGSHWLGGPDFAVEIVSPRDRSRKKLDFYAKVGVRELLLVDRKPWALELYRLIDGGLKLVGKLTPDPTGSLSSEVLPVSFRLLPADPRPMIEVTQTQDGQRWPI